MKYKYTFLLIFIALSFTTVAQNAIVVSGGNIEDSNASVSFSIGQFAYNFYSSDDGLFIQGMQQPFEIFTEQALNAPDIPTIALTFSVFPNPTADVVNLNISEVINRQMTYTLFDSNARTLIENPITLETSKITMQGYPSGTYFLKVEDQQRTIKTFKIIKN